ncbi:CCA tRNA nucleotidyltransferase [Thermophilibacter immobilis]|uniref:HD domain-containing protein n=1 Tax=Thermophilibacter immobilis TaxID=2779519 RepID=A0A7S7M7A0_9ACTN|nr:HD domain-containing protein [Thermophilibacter immobilis]QOY60054.1 HD domain-containing protein [Thermophilibacter immobilis]
MKNLPKETTGALEARLARELPGYARRVLDALEDAGHEAWVVGGWVRDALLGVSGHDVDVTTRAPWPEAARVLRAANITVHETGTAHGTVTAVVDGMTVETTTYRVEGGYSDRRHPDEVRFVDDVRADLARRDFTVNAMAFHPARGLLDPYGGRADLAARVIRAVGSPRRRFEEDALRVLRAVRFACRLDATIEPATQEALVACAGELDDIAQERIGQELDGILATGRAAWALRHEFAVLEAALPELAPLAGFDQRSPYHAYDVLEHTARVCAGAEEFAGGLPTRALRWAALLHDVAKPACWSVDDSGRGHFFDHPRQGARTLRAVMGRMALPTEVTRAAAALVELHDLPVSATSVSVRSMLAELERRASGQARPLAFALLDLKRADAVAKAPAFRSYATELDEVGAALRSALAAGPVYRVRDLAVGGEDVLHACGIEPGPRVGMVLEQLFAAVMAGELPNDRATLLAQMRW